MAVDTKSQSANGTTEQTTFGLLNEALSRGREVVDTIISPAQRAKWQDTIKQFAVNNPRLAAFLLINIILSGGPLLLFAVFTTTAFVVSLLSAVVMALIVAMLFTASLVLIALCVLVPTLFITTLAATFLFIWLLAGYHVLKLVTQSENPREVGQAVGEKLDALSGGRFGSVMDKYSEPSTGSKTGVQTKAQTVDAQDHANGAGLPKTIINSNGVSKDTAYGNAHPKNTHVEPMMKDNTMNFPSPQAVKLTA